MMSAIDFRSIFTGIGKAAAVMFTAAMVCAAPAQAQTGTDSHAQAQQQGSPQGQTGPLNTGSGGTSAVSPQGETPPNMQAGSPGAGDAPKGK